MRENLPVRPWYFMILTLSELGRLRDGNQHVKLVAACGCFDIFHIGHLEYLQGAKQLGDRLVVGVNSDRSVYWNKGKYPHFCERDRIALVNAIDVVDDVVCFDSRTFAPVLCQLRPQVFARGVDAPQKGFPERETVRSSGLKSALRPAGCAIIFSRMSWRWIRG